MDGDQTILEAFDLNPGQLDHLRIPGRQAESVTGQRDAGGTDHGRLEVEELLTVEDGQLGQVLRETFGFTVVWKGRTVFQPQLMN